MTKLDELRERAESSLLDFIHIIHPRRVLGSVHEDLIHWWTRPDAKSHQLVLLPRDHQKSTMVAYRTVWEITRNPAIRILYISSTSLLATKQLKFMKDILLSDTYRQLWPDMVKLQEAKRELWNTSEIAVDHPKRKEEAIRDPTIFTAGLTTNIAGLHSDITVMDDVVVFDNAYTEDGRERTEQQYSLLASIESADARNWIVGTRYHPKDLYGTLIDKQVELYGENGEVIKSEHLYEVYQKEVENRGDGTGEFLWPRQQNKYQQWFGFNAEILAKKRSQYLDKVQFRAQYYNDPSDMESAGISKDCFQYYDQGNLAKYDNKWFVGANRVNVCAAVDFAYTTTKRADYTCIAVVGVDSMYNYYVLEVDRFKTGHISDYFKHILSLHQKWGFRTLYAEATAAQSVIINSLKQDYIRPNGLALAIEEENPSRHLGSKEERITNILQPRYANRQMWHYKGGNCQSLEEELIVQHPPHDDIKDAVSVAVNRSIAPTGAIRSSTNVLGTYSNNRFGGVG